MVSSELEESLSSELYALHFQAIISCYPAVVKGDGCSDGGWELLLGRFCVPGGLFPLEISGNILQKC